MNIVSDARRRSLRAGALSALGMSILRSNAAAAQQVVTIAAASDLKFVLEEIAVKLLASTGIRVELIFGSSGNLSRQIQQGAPFDLFLSADESLVQRLHEQKMTLDAGDIYATGRLVLIARRAGGLKLVEDLKPLLLKANKIAIANPIHAPYGRAALQVLESLSFDDALRAKWVTGENVLQATQFVLTGAAPLGFSSAALCTMGPLAEQLVVRELPGGAYKALNQRMVLLRRKPGAAEPAASQNAQAAQIIYATLLGNAAAALFEQFGFTVPTGGRSPKG